MRHLWKKRIGSQQTFGKIGDGTPQIYWKVDPKWTKRICRLRMEQSIRKWFKKNYTITVVHGSLLPLNKPSV